jgi:hypothetical protein
MSQTESKLRTTRLFQRGPTTQLRFWIGPGHASVRCAIIAVALASFLTAAAPATAHEPSIAVSTILASDPTPQQLGQDKTAASANPPAYVTPEATALAFDLATLPSLDSIGAQTDITAFLQSGVPAELQLAALRRAWTVDPVIRDFKALNENDWDFNDLNSIPGFGDLGPEIDVNIMVAQVFGEPLRLAALPQRPARAQFFGFALPFAGN